MRSQASCLLIFSLLLLSPLFSNDQTTLNFFIQWQSYLSFEDQYGSVRSYEGFIAQHPDPTKWSDKELMLVCQTLRLKRDLNRLKKIHEAFIFEKSSETKKRIINEETAWTILHIGKEETHPRMRFESILAAVMSQDARAVPFIIKGLKDSNRYIRQFGLQVASFFPDSDIQKELFEIVQNGSTEEKNSALELLVSWQVPNIDLTIYKLLENRTPHSKNETLLRALEMTILEQKGQQKTLNERIDSLLNSKHEEDRLSVLQYAASKRDALLTNKIAKAIMDEKNGHESLLATLSLIGCNSTLLEESTKESFSKFLIECTKSSIEIVQIRALWCLFLLDTTQQKIGIEKFYEMVEKSQKEPSRLNLLIAHIRGLGTSGTPLAEKIFQSIHLPREATMTLSLYLIEQQSPLKKEAAQRLLDSLTYSTKQYYCFDLSYGAPFEIITTRHDKEPHPLLPRLRETEDLLLRMQLLSTALSILDTKPSPETIFALFQERDVFGCEYAAIQLLHGQLDIPIDEIHDSLLEYHNSPDRALSIALIIALMSDQKKGIGLIQQVLENKNIPKDTLESSISCLSQFESNSTEALLEPYLYDGAFSIKLRAAGSWLSSLSQ